MAIGNGTASRETEKLANEIADMLKQAGGQRPPQPKSAALAPLAAEPSPSASTEMLAVTHRGDGVGELVAIGKTGGGILTERNSDELTSRRRAST